MAAIEKLRPDIDQSVAPFVEDLKERLDRPRTSFHMPGHKQRPAANPALTDLMTGRELLWADLSEMSGVDYLHAATGPLREAEELAAAAFGAERTFFLVNGSTGGNQAALLSAAGEGQKVLLPRASHRSIFSALVLADAVPVYIPPVYHPDTGLALGVDTAAAERLLDEQPDIAAVFVTSPSYYGFTADLPALAGLAGRHGAPLLVDEAHGGHFSFHPALPVPALRAGADIAVQSTHKTLGSLTQSSMLHWQSGRIPRRRVEEVVAMLQSSSPSILLTASLDGARQLMATEGQSLLDGTIALAFEARAAIRRIPGLWCYGPELVGPAGVHDYDPTKLLVGLRELAISGYDAAGRLERERGIEVEIAGRDHLLFSLTFADSPEDVALLVTALSTLSEQYRSASPADSAPDRLPHDVPIPRMALTPREAFFAPSASVPLHAARDETCAEWIIPYPPGIPAVAPGEALDGAMLDYLEQIVADGATIVGPEDPSLRSVRIITA